MLKPGSASLLRVYTNDDNALDQWAHQYSTDIDAFVARVNDGHSRYWERLEYDSGAGTLKITSRKFAHCTCPWAQCPQPPKSLCTHCCRSFQTELFRSLFNRPVDVEITEGLLIGGERCRTTVRIRPS